jgi:glycosyltransferase involved in cell wall biosynthesis
LNKRILISGYEPSDFCNDIALKLKEAGHTIDLWEYRELSAAKTAELGRYYSSITSGLNDLKIRSYSSKDKIRQLFRWSFYQNWWFHSDFKLALRLSLGETAIKQRFAGYDIVNFHSIEAHTLLIAPMVPPSVKTIFSFWGSDLFKANKVRQAYQNVHIANVDQITLHSSEMEDRLTITLPNAKGKPIEKLLFGLSEQFITESFKPVNAEQLTQKRNHWDIQPGKIVVTVGYCGVPNCNHMVVFDQIASLPQEVLNSIHVIVPLTYGGEPEYREQVEERLDNLPVDSTCIRDFLSYDDLVLLRRVSDIYIHSVSTDAFSTSMLEYLISGNVGIIGDWLPYSRLNELGVYYVPFKNFESLHSTIEETVKNHPSLKARIDGNAQIIKDHLGQDYWSGQWVNVFNR